MIDDMYNIVKQINTYRKNEFKKEIIQKKEFFNLYEDFIKVNLKLVSDKKSRIKRSDINEYCLTWIHKHPIYKNHINDFDKKILKQKIESKFEQMNEKLHLPGGKVNKGWMFIKFNNDDCNM